LILENLSQTIAQDRCITLENLSQTIAYFLDFISVIEDKEHNTVSREYRTLACDN